MSKAQQHAAVLIAPGGGEYVPTSPAEANDLIFAHGYRPKADLTPEAAVAAAGEVPAADGGPKSTRRASGTDV